MSRELIILNTLALESEKSSKFSSQQHFPQIKHQGKSVDVSAWDNDFDVFSVLEKPVSMKHKIPFKKETNSQVNARLDPKKENLKPKSSQTPLAYRISTLELNDTSHRKHTKRASDHCKLLKSKNKFSSVYFPNKKQALLNTDIKRNSVPEISNLLNLLKPGKKNPVKALIVPQLKSRNKLYRSYTKTKSRKKIDFFFLSCFSPEPKKLNVKSIK